ILPVIMIMVVMAEPIVGIVYQRGSFTQESTRMTSIAFWCYSVGLLGLSLNAFFSRLFSIFQKNKIPFYITIVTSSFNILLDFILVKTALKHGGIALAASIGFSINSVIQFYFLLREINHQIHTREVLKDFFNIGSICAMLGAGSYFFYHHILRDFLRFYLKSFFWQQFAGLLIISLIAMMLYFLFLQRIGPMEIRNRLRRFVR
ncbi:MAG TPA: lipid II flippase MurJ, partial [bacterium]